MTALDPVRLLPLSAREQSVFWVQLAVLLLTARLLGSLALRLRQPRVIGELAAGVILGPSVFGALWPAGFNWFLPSGQPVQSALLLSVATISLALLLLTVGFDTDLDLLRQLGRPAAAVSAGSLLLPLAAGFVVGLMVPGSLRGPAGGQVAFALFIAIAMGASSLPVLAKIVSELGLVRRDFGQIALAAGTLNDSVGFVLLAIATGLVGGNAASQLPRVLVGLVLMGALLAVFGQRLVDRLLRSSRRRVGTKHGTAPQASLALSLVIALAAAALIQVVGVEGALGAFVAGVVLGRSRFGQSGTFRTLEQLSSALFAPLYFATAGLEANFLLLGRTPVALAFGLLVVVGAIAKYLGSYLGATWARLAGPDRVALGLLLNSRGTVQIIVGTVGLSTGVLGEGAYTAIVAMSMATTVLIPPLLSGAARRSEGTPEERLRLSREAQLAANLVVRGERILLLSRGGSLGQLAARVAHLAWPPQTAVTVLSVVDGDQESTGPANFDQPLGARDIEYRGVQGHSVPEELLAESMLGYGAIVLGAPERADPASLLSPLADMVLAGSHLPVVVVRRQRGSSEWMEGGQLATIVVPVSGGRASRSAQEVAFNLAQRTGSPVRLVHVVSRGWSPRRLLERLPRQRGFGRSGAAAADLVLGEALTMAAEYGLEVSVRVRRMAAVGEALALEAAASDTGMLVVGATVRQTDSGPFLGHVAEHLLAQVEPLVVLVALPAAASAI